MKNQKYIFYEKCETVEPDLVVPEIEASLE